MLINRRHVKISRRGAFLAAYGVVSILLGYSYFNIPPASKALLAAYFRFALSIAPMEFYGWAWIVFGVIAIIAGLVHRFDWIGFGVSVALPLFWAVSYFVAQWRDGAPRAWVNGVVFLFLAVMITLVAGMADALDTDKTPRKSWRRLL